MDSTAKLEALAGIAESFRPYTPIDDLDLFAGRLEQAAAVLETIYESGRHVIIYGDRGVGKTSLANVIDELLQRRGVSGRGRPSVVRVICESSDDFSSVWQRVFSRLTVTSRVRRIGLTGEDSERQASFAEMIPPHVRPPDVADAAALIGRTVIILDEFDRLTNRETRRSFADTLKSLSDYDSSMTVVIVGVGRDVTDLIGEHESVERCLRQVHMPRMSREEIESIIDTGLTHAGLTIDTAAKIRIIALSQGFPHYTHLLCKHAAQDAVEHGERNIDSARVDSAIKAALEEASESVKELYRRAVTPQRRQSLFEDVLLACALASETHGGTFSAGDLREPLARITGTHRQQPQFSYNLGKLCTPERGPALEKADYPGRPRYRFKNPLLEPYVLLQGHVRGILP